MQLQALVTILIMFLASPSIVFGEDIFKNDNLSLKNQVSLLSNQNTQSEKKSDSILLHKNSAWAIGIGILAQFSLILFLFIAQKTRWKFSKKKEFPPSGITPKKESIEAIENIQSLSFGLAHDLNNVFSGIMGNVSLAQKHIPSENKGMKFLKRIDLILNKGTFLTNQLSFLSAKQTENKHACNVRVALTEAFNTHFSDHHIKPIIQFQSDLWHVQIQEEHIAQILSNLTRYAIQVMASEESFVCSATNELAPSKGPTLLMNSNRVKIVIQFKEDLHDQTQLDSAFHPYSVLQENSGFGIGLTTANFLVKLNGGEISIESKPESGTLFTLYLPATEISIDDIPDSTPEKNNVVQTNKHGKILVMDDEDYIQDFIEDLLVHNGYTVETVSDGDSAISKYKQAFETNSPFECIILDLTIPGNKGGKETVSEIKNIDPNVSAIVASGYSNDEVMEHYSKYGFKGVLHKPFNSEELLKMLTEIHNADSICNP